MSCLASEVDWGRLAFCSDRKSLLGKKLSSSSVLYEWRFVKLCVYELMLRRAWFGLPAVGSGGRSLGGGWFEVFRRIYVNDQ